MTGNYGGEVLRRVRAFKPTKITPGLFSEELHSHLFRATDTYSSAVRTHPLSFAVFRQAPWHHYGLLSLERTQLSVRSPFLDNDLVKTIYRAPISSYESNDISLRLIGEGDPRMARIRTDRGLIPGDNSLNSRALQGLIDFTVKAEYAYDYGMPQWVAKIDHLLSRLHIERLFLGRHKFYHFRIWYRDVLAGTVQEILLDPRSLARPYLQRGAVEAIVKSHITGKYNYTLEINKMLTLELIHRLFLDPQSI
jgi:asparagine synthase (glutamine-hydrolysing)